MLSSAVLHCHGGCRAPLSPPVSHHGRIWAGEVDSDRSAPEERTRSLRGNRGGSTPLDGRQPKSLVHQNLARAVYCCTDELCTQRKHPHGPPRNFGSVCLGDLHQVQISDRRRYSCYQQNAREIRSRTYRRWWAQHSFPFRARGTRTIQPPTALLLHLRTRGRGGLLLRQ